MPEKLFNFGILTSLIFVVQLKRTPENQPICITPGPGKILSIYVQNPGQFGGP